MRLIGGRTAPHTRADAEAQEGEEDCFARGCGYGRAFGYLQRPCKGLFVGARKGCKERVARTVCGPRCSLRPWHCRGYRGRSEGSGGSRRRRRSRHFSANSTPKKGLPAAGEERTLRVDGEEAAFEEEEAGGWRRGDVFQSMETAGLDAVVSA